MTKNKKLGLLFMVGPITLLILIVVAYAVSSFIYAATQEATVPDVTGLTAAPSGMGVFLIIRGILSLLGVLAVLALMVGVPVGIYFLAKKEDAAILSADKSKPEYQNMADEQFLFLKKWSWGAFLGGGIWALGNKLYIWAIPLFLSLIISVINTYLTINFGAFKSGSALILAGYLAIVVIPVNIANFVVAIYLAIKGRSLAWKQGWPSFEAFKNRQKIMVWIIFAFIILAIIGSMITTFSIRGISDLESDLSNLEINSQSSNINLANLNLGPGVELGQMTETEKQQELQLLVAALRAEGIDPDINKDGVFDQLDVDIMQRTDSDIDNDGLILLQERLYGTDPLKVDTDGDGYSDKVEIDSGFDPLVAAKTEAEAAEFEISNYSSDQYKISFSYPAAWGNFTIKPRFNSLYQLFTADNLAADFLAIYDKQLKMIGDRGPDFRDNLLNFDNEAYFNSYCQNKKDCTLKTNQFGIKYVKEIEEICSYGECFGFSTNYYLQNPNLQYPVVMLYSDVLKDKITDSEKYLDYIVNTFQFSK